MAKSTAQPPKGHVKKTKWAHAYNSRHTQSFFTPDELAMISHVNCNYLSTPGAPPTLLGLKRHAQSLAVLIQKLTVCTRTVDIDQRGLSGGGNANDDGEVAEVDDDRNDRDGKRAFNINETFDWLADLSKPYDNDDEWHHAPLLSIINGVESESEYDGKPQFHCPMSQFHAADAQGKKVEGLPLEPFGTHWHLMEHANQCLTVLDHEFSSDGGLLGLVPADLPHDGPTMAALRESVLGQWILFTQHLIARMHDLEINYANCLDALAHEAILPMQLAGHDGIAAAAAGRGVAAPQDRWVLVNAGEDVSRYMHRMMDAEERDMIPREREWRTANVVGERLQRGVAADDDDKDALDNYFERGLVIVDVKTRYMRLREHGHQAPIFVFPVHGKHPSIKRTREIELLPTVVTMPDAPTTIQPVSAWSKQFGEKLSRAKGLEAENARLQRELAKYQKRRKQASDLGTNPGAMMVLAKNRLEKAVAERVRGLQAENAALKASEMRATSDLAELERLTKQHIPGWWKETKKRDERTKREEENQKREKRDEERKRVEDERKKLERGRKKMEGEMKKTVQIEDFSE